MYEVGIIYLVPYVCMDQTLALPVILVARGCSRGHREGWRTKNQKEMGHSRTCLQSIWHRRLLVYALNPARLQHICDSNEMDLRGAYPSVNA
jgi:hypothetical protein